ncbi:hypothetical protein QN277_011407 [Acacia crassicarpa]|uniref:Uncharacterized protein n=1 Tax=Acacia crassicarpa TaxID=499986 RepID=A0AAE1TCP9_9FABA|nr:hypothetical protein QN277_011407 [Acacia crassicarpa]
MDASSCRTLLRTWSAIHQNHRDKIAWPDYSAFALFPPKDFSCLPAGPPSSSPKEEEAICSMRRFVFAEEAMNNLRSTLAKDQEDEDGASTNKPTRYQVLSSFIAKHMIHAYI